MVTVEFEVAAPVLSINGGALVGGGTIHIASRQRRVVLTANLTLAW